jgi:hypothetical protein
MSGTATEPRLPPPRRQNRLPAWPYILFKPGDAIHPARLAGTDAWAAWGLTDHADPQRLELAIPARYPDSYVKALMARIVEGLVRPLWPETDPPPIDVHDRTVRSLQDGEPVTIEILDLPWYQPRFERRPAGEAVTPEPVKLGETRSLRNY